MLCLEDSVLASIGIVISFFNYYRLVRRVKEFRDSFSVLLKAIKYFAMDMGPFIIILIVFASICHSIYSDRFRNCTIGEESFPFIKDCEAITGKLIIPDSNYDSFLSSLLGGYMSLDRSSEWANMVGLGFMSQGVNLMHQITHLCLIVFLSAFGSLCFRGLTVSLCYISMQRLTTQSQDHSISSSEAEWLHTDRLLGSSPLIKKISTPDYMLCRWASKIRSSSLWSYIYYSAIVTGFGLNCASYIDEPQGLTKSKMVINYIVLVVLNIDLYLTCQTRAFQSLFSESAVK